MSRRSSNKKEKLNNEHEGLDDEHECHNNEQEGLDRDHEWVDSEKEALYSKLQKFELQTFAISQLQKLVIM